MTTTPWWAIPALTGGTALAGVLVGQMVLLWNERWKARREDVRRWHQERLKLYFDLIEEYDLARNRIDAFVASGYQSGELTVEASQRLHELIGRIRLISSEKVADAATACFAAQFACVADINRALGRWYESLTEDEKNEFLRHAVRELPLEMDFLVPICKPHVDRMATAISAFMDSVRKELGVPGFTGSQRGQRIETRIPTPRNQSSVS